MTEFLMGALGAIAVLTMLAGGFLLGWKAAGGKSRHRSAVSEQEAGLEERRRMLEEQKAFREMLNYNAETAYGMHGKPLGEEDDR